MEIIILIIVCLVCLALGFFITKVILGKDLTTFQLKVENYEKIIDEKMSEIALLKKNFEIIQDQYHQKEIFLQKVTTELEERNKNLIVVNNDFQRIQNEKTEIEIKTYMKQFLLYFFASLGVLFTLIFYSKATFLFQILMLIAQIMSFNLLYSIHKKSIVKVKEDTKWILIAFFAYSNCIVS